MEAQSSTVTIHRQRTAAAPAAAPPIPLPTLLQTPAGLALLELQGTINLPEVRGGGEDDEEEENGENTGSLAQTIPIGRLDFPDYDPAAPPGSTAWMRRVQLYVGPHQRLTGEVKKLPRPLAVVRRRRRPAQEGEGDSNGDNDLEVVEVIHYKLLFSQRPEPMTTSAA